MAHFLTVPTNLFISITLYFLQTGRNRLFLEAFCMQCSKYWFSVTYNLYYLHSVCCVREWWTNQSHSLNCNKIGMCPWWYGCSSYVFYAVWGKMFWVQIGELIQVFLSWHHSWATQRRRQAEEMLKFGFMFQTQGQLWASRQIVAVE